MLLHNIFFDVLLAFNFVSMVHIGLFSVGANLYDIRNFRRAYMEQKYPEDALPKLPLVSVVISAHNEEAIITRTLDSIRASYYPNIEIIVIDDGSKDKTAQVVRNYISRAPRTKTTSYMGRVGRALKFQRRFIRSEDRPMRMVLITQRNMGKGAALNNGIANYVRGKYTMTLDADSMLRPTAIGNAVKHLEDPNVIGVAANVRVVNSPGLVGKLQTFEHMVGYRSKKFYTLANCEFIVGGVASTYRTDILKAADMYDTDTVTEDIALSMKLVAKHGNAEQRIVYGSDVVAMTEGVQTFKALFRQRYRWKMGSLQNLIKHRALVANGDAKYSRMLTWYRLPMAVFGELMLIMEPLTLGYVLWMCLHYHTISIIFGAYMTVTAYILWTVWPDEYLSIRQKLAMSMQALYLYMLFFAMDAVQVTAIFRCLFHYEKLVHLQNDQTWVSPARSVQVAAPVA